MATEDGLDGGLATGLARRTAKSRWAGYIGMVALVALVLVILLAARDRAEGAMAAVASFLPVGYAFGAGMVASMNPCGFMLLPSYVSYQLGMPGAGESVTLRRLLRALVFASLATMGFVVIFTVMGSIISFGGEWLMGVFPYAGIAIGVAMAATGAWLLRTNGTLGILAASRVTFGSGRDVRSGFLFGVTYAITSLACTLPVFLVVVGSALATDGIMSQIRQFVGYALGMGAVLFAVTLATTLFKSALTHRLRSLTRHVHRISALFLFGAGVYLLYYWARSLWFLR